MESGQAVAGATQNTEVATDREKSTEVDQTVPDASEETSQKPLKLAAVVRGKKFAKYQQHVQQQHVKWSVAIDHVKEYLKNKESNKAQNLKTEEDPPSFPSKQPLQKRDTGFSQEHEAGQLPGYPELAEFLGSDERWLICRRYGTLQARLVLEKQDEMREIQEELDAYDLADYRKEGDDDPMQNFRLFTRRRLAVEEINDRRALMKRAEDKFKEYADLLNAVRSMACFEKPAKFEYKTVVDYVEKTAPTRPSEMEWIYHRSDIVTLRGPREHATLGAYLETYVNKLSQRFPRLQVLFKPRTWLESNKLAERLADWGVMWFLVVLIPVMFVVPIYALSKIGDDIAKSIGVLLSFALVFMLVLYTSTPAKPHEVLSGSAAYLAVLVVFFGSVNPSGKNSSSSNGNATGT